MLLPVVDSLWRFGFLCNSLLVGSRSVALERIGLQFFPGAIMLSNVAGGRKVKVTIKGRPQKALMAISGRNS